MSYDNEQSHTMVTLLAEKVAALGAEVERLREALLRLTKRHDGMRIEYAFLEAAVLEGQLEAAQYTARKIAMARTERIINGLNPPATLDEGEKGG